MSFPIFIQFRIEESFLFGTDGRTALSIGVPKLVKRRVSFDCIRNCE